MVERVTLTHLVLVRIQVPQLCITSDIVQLLMC